MKVLMILVMIQIQISINHVAVESEEIQRIINMEC